MSKIFRRHKIGAAVLNLLVPGLGHFWLGYFERGSIAMGVWIFWWLISLLLVYKLGTPTLGMISGLAGHCLAALDIVRIKSPPPTQSSRRQSRLP